MQFIESITRTHRRKSVADAAESAFCSGTTSVLPSRIRCVERDGRVKGLIPGKRGARRRKVPRDGTPWIGGTFEPARQTLEQLRRPGEGCDGCNGLLLSPHFESPLQQWYISFAVLANYGLISKETAVGASRVGASLAASRRNRLALTVSVSLNDHRVHVFGRANGGPAEEDLKNLVVVIESLWCATEYPHYRPLGALAMECAAPRALMTVLSWSPG